MEKTFIDYNTVRNDALVLAHKIYKEDNFVPDVIYTSLRGGAYMSNAISEYYKVVRKHEKPILYAAVVARSYTDLHNKSKEVMIDGWTYNPEHLRPGDKIMLIDDIYDSGDTITTLVNVFLKRGIPREHIKVVVHDYKDRNHRSKDLVYPDYYCIKYADNTPIVDTWIHYKSHEIVGLSSEDLRTQYVDEYPELKFLLKDFEGCLD